MAKQSINQPELRFKEFVDNWDPRSLDYYITPNFRETIKPLENYLALGVRSHCKGIFQKPNSDPSKIAMERLYVVHEGDLVVSITFAWEWAIAIAGKEDHGGLVSHRFPTYEFKKNFAFNTFFQYLIHQPIMKYKLQLISPGGAGRNRVMSKKDFIKLEVKVPSLPEQEKIADFLGAVDKKIESSRKRIELLKSYKKGIMQKIFSQELRFKDPSGNPFPDWEEKRIEDMYDFFSTNSLSRDNLNYESGEIYNIHYGDIHTRFNSLFDICRENVPFINPESIPNKLNKESFCQIGDLVFADASEDYLDIGKCIEVTNINNNKILAGLHTILARTKVKMYSGFAAYLFQSFEIRRKIMRIAQGTKVLGLSKKYLNEIYITIPDYKEQEKISDFLSNIDKKIEQAKNRLTHLESFKKSLLQKMFA